MGFRPRAGGGIATLYDAGSGADFYDAEVMSFGSSYWYSLGMLIDDGGNDKYSLSHYGLGSGIHLSVGALYDEGGDDQYRSRWGVVGATPHDLSVGMMVDGGGEDYYQVGDGWGGSLTNSFGLFIERAGNDLYSTRGEGCSLGNVRWARGFGGVAMFVDEEGTDAYPRGEVGHDSTTWIQGGWGIGMDLPRKAPPPIPEEKLKDPVLTPEDSARSIEECFKQASQWEVGSARESVAIGRKALLAKGVPAVVWVIENKMGTKDGLEQRPVEELFKLYPDTAGALLLKRLPCVLDDEWQLRNIVSYLSSLKYKKAVDPLLDLLDKRGDVLERVRNTIIGAIGGMEDKRAAKRIGEFADSDKERRRLAVFGALSALADTNSIPVIIKGLDDKMFTVRSVATSAMVGMGLKGIPATIEFINRPKSVYPEVGYKVIKNVVMKLTDKFSAEEAAAKYQAVQLFEAGLNSSSEQVRSECVDALLRVGGDATRSMLAVHMESEPSVVVKSNYLRVKKELKID